LPFDAFERGGREEGEGKIAMYPFWGLGARIRASALL